MIVVDVVDPERSLLWLWILISIVDIGIVVYYLCGRKERWSGDSVLYFLNFISIFFVLN